MEQENQVKENVETKPNDKELNFRAIEQKLAQEKQARLNAEQAREEMTRRIQELKNQNRQIDDDDDDDEPYVDHKRLEKKLAHFGEKSKKEIQSEIQSTVQQAIEKERMEGWINKNSDFYEVMQHADKLYEKDQELAETILKMPEGFDRQKLVYKQIKNMNLHKPAEPEKSIQQKIDQNRRSPYYQPSGVAASPYGSSGDFSSSGQKQAYEHMQALKNNLRLG